MLKKGLISALTLILGLFIVFPTFAQQMTAAQEMDTGLTPEPPAPVEWTREDLQGIYVEHLRNGGYMPSVDIDGDIQFKVSGDSYFIIVDEKDIQFFQIYMGFSLGIASREDVLNAANNANRLSKTAKVSISSDDSHRIIVSITAELLLKDPTEFTAVFPRALSLIRNAENNFIKQLTDI